MEDTDRSKPELLAEIQSLRDRLAASEETLQAIQQGEVDALIVSTPQGARVFTLQSADQSYRLLVESMAQGAAILSPEGLILYCNRSFANLLNQPLEKLIGSQFEQLISLSDLPRVQTLMQQAERDEQTAIELLLTTHGAMLPVYLSINQLNLGDLSIHCAVVTDLTAQKRHEETLAAERLARLILEQAGEAILVCDETGHIIRASEVANQLWGQPLLAQAFDALPPLSWLPSSLSWSNHRATAEAEADPNHPLRTAFAITSVLQGQNYRGLEVELDRPDGQVFSLVLNARPLSDRDNHFKGAVVILTDITARRQAETALKHAKDELELRVAERTEELQHTNDRLQHELFQRSRVEQQLRQSEARFQAFMEYSPTSVWITDAQGQMVYANRIYPQTFQLLHQDLAGRTIFDLYPADIAAQFLENIQAVASSQQPIKTIELTPRVDGTMGEFLVYKFPLPDLSGQLLVGGIAIDITERKRVEQALQVSEIRYRAIVEDQTELIVRFLPDKTLLFVNDAYCRYFGIKQDEVIGTSYSPIVYEADQDEVNRLVQAMTVEHPTVTIENRVINGQGEIRWTQWSNHMLFDAGGTLIELQAVGRDITELKQIEQSLRQSEEQRRLALDLTRIGFWDLHLPSGDLTWNDNHFTLLGLPIGFAAPRYKDWRDRIHPDDVGRVEQTFTHSIEAHIDYESEYRVMHPDGSIHWLMARGRAIYDEQTQPLRSLGVILDISDRKQMEASLQESDRRWRSLLENFQLAVIERDVNSKIEYANPFFLQRTEYLAEEVIGCNWFDTFLVPAQRQAAEAYFQQSLAQNSHTYYQSSILTKSGEECIFAWNGTILRDLDGQPIGKVSIGEDITERYKIERMKAEFISVVSHELRTPLTSMQAALSLLNEKIIDPTSAEGEATIQIATEGTDRLVRLVNDILDLERLESGKIRLDRHPCQVETLIETAVAQMQELAKQASITLKASSCDFQVEADGDRLLQVLTNLLSNAIKFSPDHSIVRVDVTQQNGDECMSERVDRTHRPIAPSLLFTVRDRGRGIPTDNLDSIFDRFQQVDASDSREKGGTGLGLAICRSIIQQHGGEIWAESILGQGSTFYFTIPMLPAEHRAP